MKIVGLDLALSGGIGLCRDDTSAETIRTTLDGDDRLDDLERQVLARCSGADLVMLEDYVTGVYASSVTGMVHGVVRLGLKRAGIPYIVMSPSGLKKLATGKGNVKKTAMAVALMQRANLELRDDNQVDAWWLRMAGYLHYDPAAVTLQLPQVNRDALKAVRWLEMAAPDRIPAMLLTGGSFQAVCDRCGHMETAHPGGKPCIGNRNLCGCGEFRPVRRLVAS